VQTVRTCEFNPIFAKKLKHVELQACNLLGTPEVAKSFLRGPQLFQTMPNTFQLCPTYFFRGIKNFAEGINTSGPALVTGLLSFQMKILEIS